MKIFHISDLHFGDENKIIIDKFLQFCREHKPDLILISGDLTQRAKKAQYKNAQTFLLNLPCAFLSVPGNHDVPLYNLFLRFIFPYKRYLKYVYPSTQVYYENNKVRVLGLNSVNTHAVKDGRFTIKHVNEIKKRFGNVDKEKINILFFHHNFVTMPTLHEPLKNYNLLIKTLETVPVDLICTGHLHYSNIFQLNKNELCAVSHAGSLSSFRHRDKFNSFNQLIIENHKIHASKIFYKDGKFISTKACDFILKNE